jgi:hypothetical protein
MLLVKQPKAPPGFDADTQPARKKIEDLIAAGERLKSEHFENKWSAFKSHLAEAQHGRCGYCDRHVLGGDGGSVDHYHPKTEIDGLYDDPSTWGTQSSHSASIKRREQQAVAAAGYHWLAYEWDNYVFACGCCNEKWKRCFFPVAVHPRCCPPRSGVSEEPLLMNCYRLLRPSEHLQFNEDGTVEAFAGSRYGYETIRTVGLYRDPLRGERVEKTRRTYEALKNYADGDDAQRQTAINDLRSLGAIDYAFAGVVRSIVEQFLGEPWDEFIG